MREWDDPFNPFNSQKALVHGRHFQAILAEQYLPPVVVNLDVCGQCNYRCPHCHHRAKQIKDQSLPMLSDRLARTFPDFLQSWTKDGARPLGCCIVGSKGDALLWPGLPDLLKRLHFVGIEVGLVSNGYAYDDKLLDYAAHYCKFVGVSMDAGTKEAYDKVHCPPEDAFERVCENIASLTARIKRLGLRNDVGFKYLILPQSYHTLLDAAHLAKQLGVRYMQIRPADLPDAAREKIDIASVNAQIEEALKLNVPGEFEVVGVRHKFTNDFRKVLPRYCHLTALTVTITSDGKVWPCVDRRWDRPTMLADCGSAAGWSALRDAWGSPQHIAIVHELINNGGCGPTCNIRCSNYGYDVLFSRVFSEDAMDRNLI
jgi:MoaA/NifB/PqqE/SkfB family radical SAM enzyme